MSGWELFTWLSVWILAGGSIIVFVFCLLQLPAMLRRQSGERDNHPGGS